MGQYKFKLHHSQPHSTCPFPFSSRLTPAYAWALKDRDGLCVFRLVRLFKYSYQVQTASAITTTQLSLTVMKTSSRQLDCHWLPMCQHRHRRNCGTYGKRVHQRLFSRAALFVGYLLFLLSSSFCTSLVVAAGPLHNTSMVVDFSQRDLICAEALVRDTTSTSTTTSIQPSVAFVNASTVDGALAARLGVSMTGLERLSTPSLSFPLLCFRVIDAALHRLAVDAINSGPVELLVEHPVASDPAASNSSTVWATIRLHLLSGLHLAPEQLAVFSGLHQGGGYAPGEALIGGSLSVERFSYFMRNSCVVANYAAVFIGGFLAAAVVLTVCLCRLRRRGRSQLEEEAVPRCAAEQQGSGATVVQDAPVRHSSFFASEAAGVPELDTVAVGGSGGVGSQRSISAGLRRPTRRTACSLHFRGNDYHLTVAAKVGLPDMDLNGLRRHGVVLWQVLDHMRRLHPTDSPGPSAIFTEHFPSFSHFAVYLQSTHRVDAEGSGRTEQ